MVRKMADLINKVITAPDIKDVKPANGFEKMWLMQLQHEDPRISKTAFDTLCETIWGKPGVREKPKLEEDNKIVVSFRDTRPAILEGILPPKKGRGGRSKAEIEKLTEEIKNAS